MKNSRNFLLLMMAGSGTRFGQNLPKQFHLVNEEPVFIYILKQLNKISELDDIVIVTNPNFTSYTKECIDKNNFEKAIQIINGGSCRSESILFGLQEVKKMANDDDVVLMYDATHPIVDKEGVSKVINTIKEYGAASLVQHQCDTIYKIDEETSDVKEILERREIVAAASPEGFKFGKAFDIYTKTDLDTLNQMTSAGALAKHFGVPFKTVPMEKALNLKITYSIDMEIFKKIAAGYSE